MTPHQGSSSTDPEGKSSHAFESACTSDPEAISMSQNSAQLSTAPPTAVPQLTFKGGKASPAAGGAAVGLASHYPPKHMHVDLLNTEQLQAALEVQRVTRGADSCEGQGNGGPTFADWPSIFSP